MISRRQFLESAAGGALLLGCGSLAGKTRRPARNNVLLVIADQHNPAYTSVHGHPTVRTPNLQRLADQGTVFESAYVPSPLCRPCRSSLMVGRRVHEIQTYNNCSVFSREDLSYGKALRDQGVYSVLLGRVDSYRPASELGFSEIIAPRDRNPPGDTFMQRRPVPIRPGAAERARRYGVSPAPFRRDDARLEAAVRWLRETGNRLPGPWSLCVNFFKPHSPQWVTEELWDLYPEGGDLPIHGGDLESAGHPYARDLRRHFQTDRFSEEQIRGLRRGYLGSVTYVDRLVGRLLTVLEETGQLDRTVFAYTADHGEMLGKFGMWWKSSLYEGSASVPLFVRGPGFGPGRQVRTAVDIHDLRAALFHAVGARQPAGFLGSPLQEIPAEDPERVVFSEYHGHGVRASGYLIRKGPWKLIYCCEAPHQLFQLDDDPHELSNLAARRPRKLAELTEELRAVCDPELENRRAEEFIGRQSAAVRAMSHGG